LESDFDVDFVSGFGSDFGFDSDLDSELDSALLSELDALPRPVVRGVEPAALEADSDRIQDLVELPMALGTGFERLVAHPLLDLELVAAIAAAITVNGHLFVSFWGS